MKSSALALARIGRGRDRRSTGVRGVVPVTTSKGERPVLRLTELLYANSACGSRRSHVGVWS